jgi:hypothetical protein
VAAIVVDIDPASAPTMAAAIARFGQPTRRPTSRSWVSTWSADRTGGGLAVTAESDPTGERLVHFEFAPADGVRSD